MARPEGKKRCPKGTRYNKKKDDCVPKKAAGAAKRPLNAFMLFSGAKRAAVKKAHPDMVAKEVAAELGRMWREASAKDKATYQKKAAAARTAAGLGPVVKKGAKAKKASSPKKSSAKKAKHTVKELKALAKAAGVKGITKMKRAELLAALGLSE